MASFDFTNVVGNPTFLGSFGLSVIGWFIAFLAAIIGSGRMFAPQLIWFVILFDFFILAGIFLAVGTDSIRYYRLAILTLLGVGISLGCSQVHNNIYWYTAPSQALGAGFIFLTIVQLFWVFLFGSEEGSFVHNSVSAISINKNTSNPHQNETKGGPTNSNLAMALPQLEHHMSQVIVSPNAEYAYKSKALYEYQANPEDPNELSFSKGEILDIVDNKGKWWQAKKLDGSVGIAPSNYLQII
ncbi:hypothetical protein G9A89_023353 [Geosiphon pyriformis]|nr:hypothetical protein G9A89_023353 [Geosiphon pyriformis]